MKYFVYAEDCGFESVTFDTIADLEAYIENELTADLVAYHGYADFDYIATGEVEDD
jgi:hypothetical protein